MSLAAMAEAAAYLEGLDEVARSHCQHLERAPGTHARFDYMNSLAAKVGSIEADRIKRCWFFYHCLKNPTQPLHHPK